MPEPITIKCDPVNLLLGNLLGAAGITLGVAGMMIGLFGMHLNALIWIGSSVTALALGFSVLGILSGKPNITIDAEGFTFRTPIGPERKRRWADIDGPFTVIRVGMLQGVAYRLTPAFKQTTPIKPNSAFQGYDEMIGGSLRVSKEELAKLLNEHKNSKPAV